MGYFLKAYNKSMNEEDRELLKYLERRERDRQEWRDKVIRFLIPTAIGVITLYLWYKSSS